MKGRIGYRRKNIERLSRNVDRPSLTISTKITTTKIFLDILTWNCFHVFLKTQLLKKLLLWLFPIGIGNLDNWGTLKKNLIVSLKVK